MNDASASDLARAQALIELRRFRDAKLVLEGMGGRGSAPTSRGWCLLAQCNAGLGFDYGSLRAADQAVALDPENEWAHRLRAMALLPYRQYEAAEAAAAESLLLAPFSSNGQVALAQVYLAWPYRSHQAVSAAKAAVALAPTDSTAHFIQGLAFARAGQTRRAKASYRAALKLDPDYSVARNNLGVLALARGRAGIASEHFASSIQSDPHSQLGVANLSLTFRVLLSRLSLLLRVMFWTLWLIGAIEFGNAARWTPLRAICFIFGTLLTIALFGYFGGASKLMFKRMYGVRSVRWRMLEPAGLLIGCLILAVIPTPWFFWPTPLLLALLIAGFVGNRLSTRCRAKETRSR